MRVGIVNFNRHGEPTDLIDVLERNNTVYLLNHSEKWLSIIKRAKDIKHWFFTGSSYDVLSPISPQVSTEIFKMKDKSFFLICYSMESALHNLGHVLAKKPRTNRRFFDVNGIRVWKSHDTYAPVSANPRLKPIATYEDEIMTLKYKNAIMTQWHPERTPDGVRVIDVFLQN